MLSEMSSVELTAWFEYLRVDDEVRMQQIVYAIIKAFGGTSTQQTAPHRIDNEEEIIDTTDPNFTKLFKGFSYEKPQSRRRPRRQTSTEIKFG
jgi:hypothetical protein